MMMKPVPRLSLVEGKEIVYKVTKDKSLRSIKSSSYYGYWLRLKKLGFRFVGRKFIARGNKIVYFENYWKFKRDDETLLLMVSRRKQKLVVKIGNEVIFNFVTTDPSELEEPFLEYFGETDPLFIRRLGPQPQHIRKWQIKWTKHIKKRGKWAKMLREMGVFDSAELMPVAKNVRPVKKDK